QDADAEVEPPAAGRDEVPRGPLEPGSGHPALGGVPHRGEALPVTGVPPQRPVLHELADRQPLRIDRRHEGAPFVAGTLTPRPSNRLDWAEVGKTGKNVAFRGRQVKPGETPGGGLPGCPRPSTYDHCVCRASAGE